MTTFSLNSAAYCFRCCSAISSSFPYSFVYSVWTEQVVFDRLSLSIRGVRPSHSCVGISAALPAGGLYLTSWYMCAIFAVFIRTLFKDGAVANTLCLSVAAL